MSDKTVQRECTDWLQGLRSVGPHVVEKFCEIVKLRNQLARLAGFEVSPYSQISARFDDFIG